MMTLKERILRLLEHDSKLTAAQIAAAVRADEAEVAAIIEKCEDDGTIVGYQTLINWNKTEREYVSAIIEIKVQLQRGAGFDNVAKTICAYPEVTSLRLMSGGFDLLAVIEGRTLKEVAMFVSEKLSVIDGVLSTATHFVLNPYKENGEPFDTEEQDTRVFIEI